MEACPRLDMFPQPSFVCAQESSSLGLAVKKLIRVWQLTFFCLLHIFCFIYNFFLFLQLQYNENPEDFRSEVTTFTSLRNESCVKILTNSDIGLKNLKRYYCQLAFFRNRFKVLDSPLMKNGPFDFPWSEADDDLLMGKFYTIFWRIILIFSFWLLLRFL